MSVTITRQRWRSFAQAHLHRSTRTSPELAGLDHRGLRAHNRSPSGFRRARSGMPPARASWRTEETLRASAQTHAVGPPMPGQGAPHSLEREAWRLCAHQDLARSPGRVPRPAISMGSLRVTSSRHAREGALPLDQLREPDHPWSACVGHSPKHGPSRVGGCQLSGASCFCGVCRAFAHAVRLWVTRFSPVAAERVPSQGEVDSRGVSHGLGC